MGIHSLPARRWGRIGLVALLGLTIALVTVSAGHAKADHAVAAKKKCKKKHKSAASAKKKKCKKKKAVVPPVTPPVTPSNPTPSGPTLRASLSFDDVSTNADLDLYVWDAEGNLAYFDGNAIPDSFTTSNSPSPEQFFDQRSPSARDFTYGVCVYDDGDGEDLTATDVDYTLDAPGDSPSFSDNGTLHGTGDTALYVGPYDPDPGNTGSWCISYLTP